eukprot:GAHX01000543.1.p1 GENE.GAHX01000543.1~~GAHX01000543.1.p1  ORF type:complete len:299 (+),score=60.38 GAHX01000543.1:40-936(+)
MSSGLHKDHIDLLLKFIFGDTLEGVINKDQDSQDENNENTRYNTDASTELYIDDQQTINHEVHRETRAARYRNSKALGSIFSNKKFSCKSCHDPAGVVFCNQCTALFHKECAVSDRLCVNNDNILCNDCYKDTSTTDTIGTSLGSKLTPRNNLDLLSLVALQEYTDFPNSNITSKFEYAQILKVLIKLKQKLTPNETNFLTDLITKETGLMDCNYKTKDNCPIDEKKQESVNNINNINNIKNINSINKEPKFGIGNKTPLVNFMLGVCQIEGSIGLDEIVELIRSMVLKGINVKEEKE